MATTQTARRSRTTGRSSTSTRAKSAAKDTAGTAKSEASRVVDRAGESAGDVAATGKQQAKQVTGQAMEQAQELMGQASEQLQQQATDQTQRLSTTLHELAGHFDTMAGAGEQGSMAHSLVRQLADRTHQAAGYLDGKEPGDILDDLQNAGRRSPGAFLGVAALAGVVAGRFTGAAKRAPRAGSETSTVDPYPGGGW